MNNIVPLVPAMRAKVRCSSVIVHETCDEVEFNPVCKSTSYGDDGLDEDNTFAKYSPSGSFKLTIANPELLGKYRPGQVYYVDFSPVPEPEAQPDQQD